MHCLHAGIILGDEGRKGGVTALIDHTRMIGAAVIGKTSFFGARTNRNCGL